MKRLLLLCFLCAAPGASARAAEARSFPITLVRVVDGDTIVAMFDLGFDLHMERQVRLLCVNTPEVYGETKVAGLAAKAAAVTWLAEHAPLSAWLPRDPVDKYGRTLAVLYPRVGGTSLNRHLIEGGNAALYLCADGTVY